MTPSAKSTQCRTPPRRAGCRERRAALRGRVPPKNPTSEGLREAGDVVRSEFDLLVTSPLSLVNIGHPAWRIDPSYVKFEGVGAVLVTNSGGRGHTFTRWRCSAAVASLR